MLKNYLIVAWRNLQRNKIFSIINIAGLSAGIAASMLLFMVIRYELSYDTFQPNYHNLYRVVTSIDFSDGISYNSGIAYPALPALRAAFPDLQFAALASEEGSQVKVPAAGNKGNARFIVEEGIFFCEPQFFTLFSGYQWLAGSAAALSEPNSVVLGKGEAQKYFGSAEAAIGKTIVIDNLITARVNGVLDEAPQNTDVPLKVLISFVSLPPNGRLYGYNEDWGNVSSNHQIFALLPPGIGADGINKRLAQFSAEHYSSQGSKKINFLQPLSDMHFDTRFDQFGSPNVSKSTLWTLSLVGMVIIAMACINFINLSTARSVNRSREVGIRKVLGSTRANLFRQLMGETALIVFIALVIALCLVQLSLPYIKHVALIEEELTVLTGENIAMLMGLAIVVTLLAGLYPAIVMSRFSPITALKHKFRLRASEGGSILLRRALVIVQFAISQVLIIATLVMISQMNYISQADLGFNKEAVLVLAGNADSVSVSRLPQFKQQLLSLPGVLAVSCNNDMPSSSNGQSTNFSYNHLPDEKYQLYVKYADEDYLKTYGLQLVAGRNLQPSDTVREAVINEELAARLSPNNINAVVGKDIKMGGRNPVPIVGVVKDFKTTSLREGVRPLLLSTRKNRYTNTAVKLRTASLTATVQRIQELWNRTYPDYAYNASFFEDNITGFYTQEQQLSRLYKIFAALAIFISCLGLYGLVSFMAVQKTKEVGIRKVLGAGVRHIIFIFSKEFTWLIFLAFALAAPLAWWLSSSWLQHFAYSIRLGASVFVVAIALSVLITWLTVGYKALQAAIVNPVKSLRSE